MCDGGGFGHGGSVEKKSPVHFKGITKEGITEIVHEIGVLRG